MKSALITKTGLRKRGANGVDAIVFVDGDARSGDERWADVKALPHPKIELGSEIWLESGEKTRLPFNALPWILPDRTGVLVLFDPGEYVKPDGTDVFPKPNNAAIYNADGGLRFQLRLPEGHYRAGRIGGIHSGGVPTDDAIRTFVKRLGIHSESIPDSFEGMLGVVVAAGPDAPPEWVYLVDPNSPELIPTGQWVRW